MAKSNTFGQTFLDDLKSRTVLSALIGGSVKLTKSGREFKGCCPVHNEKTPSFTVNDDKGFAHCFGCGAHFDAIGWLTQQGGLTFIEAVEQLAASAGMVVPARSAEAAARQSRIEGIRPTLEAAQSIYAAALAERGDVRDYWRGRGVSDHLVAAFGIGFAPAGGGLRGRGFMQRELLASGLCGQSDQNFVYPRFKQRITVPVHDARGRLIGFGGRAFEAAKDVAKWINTPATELFDKGRVLFNHHRARACAVAAKRIIVVEGYFDVTALAGVGIGEAVASMGTAITIEQIELLWRSHHRPILMFDGDAAGQKAALRACETAMPRLGPGREIAIACLPAGVDPDDVAGAGRGADWGWLAGRAAVEAVLADAVPLCEYLIESITFDQDRTPEEIAGIWARLSELARSIVDDETRAQYLGVWRARFERLYPVEPLAVAPLHSVVVADGGDYAFPDSENDSERHLFGLVQQLLTLNEERRAIADRKNDVLAMAKAIGFDKVQMNRVVRDIEADAGAREEKEAVYATYRRVLGVRGPLSDALMPSVVDARVGAIKGGPAPARLPSWLLLGSRGRMAGNCSHDS